MKLAVLCPHFAPDTAPTGEVITRIVLELAELGHELHVVTALPWYLHHRVERGWQGKAVRVERTEWGSITRVNPFPTDKRSIARRASAFIGFSALSGMCGLRGGRVDGVLAMSPPLTLGATGWGVHVARRGPLVFNVQDVFPDAAIELGAVTNTHLIRVARGLEKASYRAADAITVLSEDMRLNVVGKLGAARESKVRIIPNFVDAEVIAPVDRLTAYRAELGIGDELVVMYAGNVGLSQSLDLLIAAARELVDDPNVVFVVNGGGSNLDVIKASARNLPNVRFCPYQPRARIAEVLGTADVHLVPLRAGLARSSVPSKMYSILAAGRPILASVDSGTEVERVVRQAEAGLAVQPDSPALFIAALRELLANGESRARMGESGRGWVTRWMSPAAVAAAYEALFCELSPSP